MDDPTSSLILHGMKLATQAVKPSVMVVSRFVAKKLDTMLMSIPKRHRVEAERETAAPALIGLACTEDGSVLQEMYFKLLSQTVDRRKSKNTHPAFGHVIQQMSRDEAVLLMILRDNPTFGLQRADVPSIPERKTIRTDTVFLDKKIVKEHRIREDRLPMYFEHLLNLNLLEWRSRPSRLKMASNGKVHEIGILAGVTEYPFTSISTFGRCFIATCLPDKFPPKRKRGPKGK
jgi:hypothetical protein